MSQRWGFRDRWMVDASMHHRSAIENTCMINVRDMCRILDRAYEYVLPAEKEEFNAWQKVYRSPHQKPDRKTNTAQGYPDVKPEQPTEQEENLRFAIEVMEEDTVLEELENAIRDDMIPRTFSLRDINASQNTMNASDSDSATLEDVFKLEEDDGEEDTTTDNALALEDAHAEASLRNGSQLEEDDFILDATSRLGNDYLLSDTATQMNDWASAQTEGSLGLSSQPEDECPDLDNSSTTEEDSTPDNASQPKDESPALDDGSHQGPSIPETIRERMPGLLKAKLERNTVFEHVLTMMNQPSLKPTVRRTVPVPQDFQETYDNAVIRIEELKSLWYCVKETEQYLQRLERTQANACKDLRVKAEVYKSHLKDLLGRMKSKGQASRLDECIGIDEPWPEAEWGMPLAKKPRRMLCHSSTERPPRATKW
ncbi:hypothetical protein CEP54_000206 [Fusarium duplospermum]|uniref:Uncharacterized protein n=1 Tax=Fusarium duplospermum TaxID=1325734 RepID=A0A428R856_9HYPO|nr:hypothetical protein CEP54_000206 [Fusarium duplospermum]